MGKEIKVTVNLVFSVDLPDTVKTPENILAEHLVDKLSLDVKWATIKQKTVISER